MSFRKNQFSRAAESQFEDLAQFLSQDERGSDNDGLVPGLIGKLDEIASTLVQNLAGSLTQGALADLSA